MSYIVDLFLEGQLNQEQMLDDFSNLKKIVKEKVDLFIDHKTVINLKKEDKLIENKNDFEVLYQQKNNEIIYLKSPKQSLLFLNKTINKSYLEKETQQYLKKFLPKNITKITIKFKKEASKGDYFNYCHGLKMHKGNCQRITHGHRSKLQIKENNTLSKELTQKYKEQFKNIYFGTNSDLITFSLALQKVKPKLQEDLNKHLNIKNYSAFNYIASHGEYILILAKKKCYFFANETTIEQICLELCKKIKNTNQNKKITLTIYEGINKGATTIL